MKVSKKLVRLRRNRLRLLKKWTAMRDDAWRGREKERIAFDRSYHRMVRQGLTENEILRRFLKRSGIRKELIDWTIDFFSKAAPDIYDVPARDLLKPVPKRGGHAKRVRKGSHLRQRHRV